MGKITEITRQKKKETRVSIFMDGEFVCGLDELTFAQSRISVGDEMEVDELMEICRESEKRTAFDKAVKYISYRQRTKKEVREHLKGKGYLPQSISYALDKLGDGHLPCACARYGKSGRQRYETRTPFFQRRYLCRRYGL